MIWKAPLPAAAEHSSCLFSLSFTSSLPLSSTPWTCLCISFCCNHPCLSLSSKSSFLAPLGRISQTLLLSLLSFYLFLSLSSPAFPLTQAVSRGICHHRVYGASMDDAFKLGRGGMLDSDANKPGLQKCRRFTGHVRTQCCLLQQLHFCY